jgi:hypothetical protein
MNKQLIIDIYDQVKNVPTRPADTASGLDMVPLTVGQAAALASSLARSVSPDCGNTSEQRAAVLRACEGLAENFHPSMYEVNLFRRAVEAAANPRPFETRIDAALHELIAGVDRWQHRQAAQRAREQG